MLWLLQRLAKDIQSVAEAEDHLRCCGGYRGWLRTYRVLQKLRTI